MLLRTLSPIQNSGRAVNLTHSVIYNEWAQPECSVCTVEPKQIGLYCCVNFFVWPFCQEGKWNTLYYYSNKSR